MRPRYRTVEALATSLAVRLMETPETFTKDKAIALINGALARYVTLDGAPPEDRKPLLRQAPGRVVTEAHVLGAALTMASNMVESSRIPPQDILERLLVRVKMVESVEDLLPLKLPKRRKPTDPLKAKKPRQKASASTA